MQIVWECKTFKCDVMDLGGVDSYRLTCEGLAKNREDHLLDHIGVEYIVQSRTNNQFDGALMLDFNREDMDKVVSYFGVNSGQYQ